MMCSIASMIFPLLKFVEIATELKTYGKIVKASTMPRLLNAQTAPRRDIVQSLTLVKKSGRGQKSSQGGITLTAGSYLPSPCPHLSATLLTIERCGECVATTKWCQNCYLPSTRGTNSGIDDVINDVIFLAARCNEIVETETVKCAPTRR